MGPWRSDLGLWKRYEGGHRRLEEELDQKLNGSERKKREDLREEKCEIGNAIRDQEEREGRC